MIGQYCALGILAAWIGLGSVSAGEAPSKGIEIAVVVSGQADAVPVTLTAKPQGDGTGPPPPPQTSSLVAPTRFALLPRGLFTDVRLEAEGYWAPPVVVTAGSPEALTIRLYPTATVTGQVSVERGETIPGEIYIRFQQAMNARSEEPVPLGTQPCPIQDGRFRCAVPAGTLDLRARAEGFISHYRWGKPLQPGSTLDLGELPLRRGGSIVGWVEFAPGTTVEGKLPSLAGITVQAEPRAAPGPSSDPRLPALAASTETDQRGFFHLTGISPGQYRLVALKEGFAPGTLETSNILDNSETNLARAVVLRRPAQVSVDLFPAKDPAGQPWWLTLFPLDERTQDAVAEGPATGEGTWLAREIPQGRYSIEVKDAFGSRWHHEEVEIREEAARLEVQLDAQLVEGTITFDGQPLEADLWFGGQHGFRRIAFQSNAEGEFEGMLPLGERWPVAIESREPAIETLVHDVEVVPGEYGIARVRIDLVDRKVEGRVTDPDGEPAPEVWVFLQGQNPPGRPIQKRADKDGVFSFGPLEPGEYRLQAMIFRSAISSPRVPVEVPEKEQVPFQHLRLERGRILTGTVVSPFGPVTGATVSATPLVGEEPAATVLPQDSTDVDGAFRLEIPGHAEKIRMTIAAPAFALKVMEVDARLTAPVTVPVRPDGGTLRLHFPPQLSFDEMRFAYYLLHGGLPLNSVTLYQWTRSQGGGLLAPGVFEVPSVDPGEITVCARSKGGPRCESAWVPPLGVLDLHFPPLPEEE